MRVVAYAMALTPHRRLSPNCLSPAAHAIRNFKRKYYSGTTPELVGLNLASGLLIVVMSRIIFSNSCDCDGWG